MATPRQDGQPRRVLEMMPADLRTFFEPEQIAALDRGEPVLCETVFFVDLIAVFDAVVSDGMKASGTWVIA